MRGIILEIERAPHGRQAGAFLSRVLEVHVTTAFQFGQQAPDHGIAVVQVFDHVGHHNGIIIIIGDRAEIELGEIHLVEGRHPFKVFLAVVVIPLQIHPMVFALRKNPFNLGGRMIAGADIEQAEGLVAKGPFEIDELVDEGRRECL